MQDDDIYRIVSWTHVLLALWLRLSGDITLIRLIRTKYEGNSPPAGAHGEKNKCQTNRYKQIIKSKGAMLVYHTTTVRVVILYVVIETKPTQRKRFILVLPSTQPVLF